MECKLFGSNPLERHVLDPEAEHVDQEGSHSDALGSETPSNDHTSSLEGMVRRACASPRPTVCAAALSGRVSKPCLSPFRPHVANQCWHIIFHRARKSRCQAHPRTG